MGPRARRRLRSGLAAMKKRALPREKARRAIIMDRYCSRCDGQNCVRTAILCCWRGAGVGWDRSTLNLVLGAAWFF
jgi:hypothetical protein